MPILLILLALGPPLLSAQEKTLAEADAAIAAFQAALRQELQSAMQEKGPVGAIAICREKAPGLTRDLSARYGLTLRRTALRYRNPANAPDAWEKNTLVRFARQRAQGADYATLRATRRSGKTLRYLKAIETQAMCMVCHGTKLSPPVAAAIRQHYPADRATGFAPGDLRGAFSLTLRLP